MKAISLLLSGTLLIAGASTASAQLTAASEGPVVYGHHHLNVTSVDEHKRFWIDTLGGVPASSGPLQTPRDIFTSRVIKFPNVFVVMTERAPEGGTKGTSVNHIGFSVPSVAAMLAKVRAAGYPIVSREELPASLTVENDMAHIADQDTFVAYIMGPDDVKVELFESRDQAEPIALHHIHFAAQDVDAVQAWYAKTFGAAPGMRGSSKDADLPGVNLTFSPSADPVVGTQGRSLDHIGFEVENLEEFCKTLEAAGVEFSRPYTVVESVGLAIAFLTDPFGTYIELTEGLDEL